MLHLAFKAETGLPEFFGRYLFCSLRRPSNNGCDTAAVFEQTALVFCPEARVGEAGEMQHGPESIARVGEVVARGGGTRSRIEPAENHGEAFGKDIRFIAGQTRLQFDLCL